MSRFDVYAEPGGLLYRVLEPARDLMPSPEPLGLLSAVPEPARGPMTGTIKGNKIATKCKRN